MAENEWWRNINLEDRFLVNSDNLVPGTQYIAATGGMRHLVTFIRNNPNNTTYKFVRSHDEPLLGETTYGPAWRYYSVGKMLTDIVYRNNKKIPHEFDEVISHYVAGKKKRKTRKTRKTRRTSKTRH